MSCVFYTNGVWLSFLFQDFEAGQLLAAAKIRGSGGDLDLEPIPDCVSLASFRRKSMQSNTLPAETSIPNGMCLCQNAGC
jgi:hypothetical protein